MRKLLNDNRKAHKPFDFGEYYHLVRRAVKSANLIMQKIIFIS